jgi:hypothetical protein
VVTEEEAGCGLTWAEPDAPEGGFWRQSFFENGKATGKGGSKVPDQIHATKSEGSQELGIVICKECDEVIGTLPTDGVKKIYSVCQGANCAQQNQMIAGESM